MNVKIVLILGLFIVGTMALGEEAEEFSEEELAKLVPNYKRFSPLLQRQSLQDMQESNVLRNNGHTMKLRTKRGVICDSVFCYLSPICVVTCNL
jgi:hypothetical protein